MPTWTGNSGESTEDAIVILDAQSEEAGVQAEYQWLALHLGRRGEDFEVTRQGLVANEGKYYDRLDVRLDDGTEKSIFFDISGFFGKR